MVHGAPNGNMSSGAICSHCKEDFELNEQIYQTKEDQYHMKCFVCCQCFEKFPNGVFYEFDGRKYCEHDFHVLFAPACNKCKTFIIGRVIKANNASWHPQCFTCAECDTELVSKGFVKSAGRALCHDCNGKERVESASRITCHKCRGYIEPSQKIKFRAEYYHSYHFNCASCGMELNSDAREIEGELYCLKCHDKKGISICGACRRPIEERVVHALGKTWHVDHFVCARCEKPFLGSRHYEKKGLAYCELHYQQLFGRLCYACNQVISGEIVNALEKCWCIEHFTCSTCDKQMDPKVKFYEIDMKPVCKSCYECHPLEMRKRIAKLHKLEDYG